MSSDQKTFGAESLSRRGRQILEVVYRLQRATAAEIRAALPDPPSYSAVRTHLRILEERGHVKHESDGPRYVYMPEVPREKASRGAIRHMVDTFFEGSVARAVAALLDTSSEDLSSEEAEHLEELIKSARQEASSQKVAAKGRKTGRKAATRKKGERT